LSRTTRLADLALLSIAAIWGCSFVVVKDAVAAMPVLPFLAYRFVLATALVAWIFRRRLAVLPRAGWRAGVGMGAALTAGFVLQTFGIAATSAANAGFITGLAVVLTPLLGAWFFGTKAAWETWVGAGVATLGLFLLSGAGGSFNQGDLLVLLSAFAFALHVLLTDRGVRDFAPGALLALQLGTLALVALGAAAAQGELVVPRGPALWAALVGTALLASAGAFFLQTWAQRHSTPARTSLFLASEPVFAGFAAYLLAGERLTARGLVGAALIVAAMVSVELVRIAREKP
jgi:drug/metabolite transporter (DMT)-like permease